jgi:anthranilate synthase component 2
MQISDLDVCILDNYDSFTYNIVGLLNECGVHSISLCKNDLITDEDVEACDLLIISPGPDIPENSGRLMDVIGKYWNKKPMLGICLGMQALGIYFGAKLVQKETVSHGIKATIIRTAFEGLYFPTEFASSRVGLYHSWMLSDEGWPEELRVTAKDTDGVIMAFSHKYLPLDAVQFHPESFMTEDRLYYMSHYLENLAVWAIDKQGKKH